ncbi:carbohydrate sulfotransferase 15-like isoform X2 [Pecten maximus]|uniref:carbohydrate sulfotransferase 15-like isoform X2 n=1 Tax=Pecten maximus TaxID=6579 RepID=UPI00145884AD|nr:carbohydrate sulfotransferase 15-like isoform X2 [Pecten maximus]
MYWTIMGGNIFVKYSHFHCSTMHCALKQWCAILGAISLIYFILLCYITMKYTETLEPISAFTKYHESDGIHMYVKGNLYGIGDHLAVARVLQSNNTGDVRPHFNLISGPVAHILKEKPPVFLPEFKNPCWYADGDDRREVWISYLCRNRRIKNGKLCSLYFKRKRLKNAAILRCLPYFLLIGQPKSGSTDLFRRITSHPDVIPGLSKEPHWWTRNRHCLSEGSQSYLWDHTWWWLYPENENDTEPGIHNAHLLRHILPDVKLLVIVRNPVDRLYSDYLYFNQSEQKSVEVFDRRVRASIDSFNYCLRMNSLHVRHCAYKEAFLEVRLTIGLYAVYLEDWMDVFPRQQFFVVSLDEYSVNQTIVASRIFKFLDLSDVPEKISSSTHYNKNMWHGKAVGDMLNETRLLLEQFYKPYNQALSLLLNDSRFLWET